MRENKDNKYKEVLVLRLDNIDYLIIYFTLSSNCRHWFEFKVEVKHVEHWFNRYGI